MNFQCLFLYFRNNLLPLRDVFSKHRESFGTVFKKVSELVENLCPGVVWYETSENDVEIFKKLLPEEFWRVIQILLLENKK